LAIPSGVPASEVRLRIASISRGLRLIAGAQKIGGSEKRSPTDRARDQQWQFAATYSGFEIAMKGLFGPTIVQDQARLTNLLAKYAEGTRVHAPVTRSSRKIVRAGEDIWLVSFLAPWTDERRNDPKVIRSWLIKGEAPQSWSATLSASKFVRNATVHGALSATRMIELGLVTRSRGTSGVSAIEALGRNLRFLLAILIERVLNASDTNHQGQGKALHEEASK
jgi:hypothetical protein